MPPVAIIRRPRRTMAVGSKPVCGREEEEGEEGEEEEGVVPPSLSEPPPESPPATTTVPFICGWSEQM
jgi:hypothetical protein